MLTEEREQELNRASSLICSQQEVNLNLVRAFKFDQEEQNYIMGKVIEFINRSKASVSTSDNKELIHYETHFNLTGNTFLSFRFLLWWGWDITIHNKDSDLLILEQEAPEINYKYMEEKFNEAIEFSKNIIFQNPKTV